MLDVQKKLLLIVLVGIALQLLNAQQTDKFIIDIHPNVNVLSHIPSGMEHSVSIVEKINIGIHSIKLVLPVRQISSGVKTLNLV